MQTWKKPNSSRWARGSQTTSRPSEDRGRLSSCSPSSSGSGLRLTSLALLKRVFDPYPYILLNLVLSTLAALQAPVIMMSQNRQAAKDRIKSDLDFEVNRKAELEIADLHRKLDRMYDHVQEHWGEQEKQRKAAAKLDDDRILVLRRARRESGRYHCGHCDPAGTRWNRRGTSRRS